MDDPRDDGHGVGLETGHDHVVVQDGGGDDDAGVHGTVPGFLLLPKELLLAAAAASIPGERRVGEPGERVVQLDNPRQDVVPLASVASLNSKVRRKIYLV